MAFPFYKQHWIDVDERRMEAYNVVLQYHPHLEPLLAPLELALGLSVLDVGCGPGYVTAELARRVGETGKAVGIDINEMFVATARAHAEEKGVGHIASFQQADFPPLPFPDRSFDRILCKNVLEYVDSAGETLKEMARVLRREGRVLVLDSDWDMLALEEHGVMAEEDFREFVFVHPAKLWTDMNPNFFKGTVVEKQVEKLLAQGVK